MHFVLFTCVFISVILPKKFKCYFRPGKMDSLKRRGWKTEINNEKSQSISSSKRLAASPASNIEPGQLNRGTSIVRIEGFVNIMLSPLLLVALNR